MAVQNKYIDANVVLGKAYNPALVTGGQPFILTFTFEVAAADDDASVYRVGRQLNPNLIPVKFDVWNDAITNGTDYDIGLYKPTTPSANGAVIDINVFADALDMSSAVAVTGTPKIGLEGLDDIAHYTRRLFEHAGHTEANKLDAYDIAFTANTVGTAAGTITGVFYFVQG